MLNSKLFTLGTLAVLTFGLAACSPDKKPDTWSVDAPQIALKSGSEVGFTDKADRQKMDRDMTQNLREMSHRTLPSNADVVFPSLASADAGATPFSITITANCSFGDLKATEQKTLHSVSRFPLLTIIPSKLTVTALSSATYYDCSVNLAVSNQIGSVENFTLPSIYVQNLDHVSGVTIETFDTQQVVDDSVPQITYGDAHRFVLDQTSELGSSLVQMVCDLHSLPMQYTNLSEFHIDDLIPKESTDDATWKQTCRLVVTPNGHPENVQLSKRFVLIRPQAALSPVSQGIPCAEYLNRKVFAFQLTNSSDQTQITGLHIPKRLHASSAPWGGNQANYIDSSLKTTVVNTETVTDADGKVWFSMAPGETKVVHVDMDQSFDSHACPVDNYMLGFATSDASTQWWPVANPNPTPAESMAHLLSVWDDRTPTTIEQTGHYRDLSEIQPNMKVVSDISTIIPFANLPGQTDPAKGSLLEGNKQSTY